MDVLGIPVVLQTVFSQLDTKTIAICRLVNTTWNHEACKILKNRVQINFVHLIDLTHFNSLCELSSRFPLISLNFTNFLFAYDLFMSAAQDFPIPSLHKLNQLLQQFVKLAGKQVIRLRIIVKIFIKIRSGPEKYTTMQFREMLEMIYKYFPNLKDLRILFNTSSLTIPTSIVEEAEILLENYSKIILPKLKLIHLDAMISTFQDNSTNKKAETDYEKSENPEIRIISTFIKYLVKNSPNLIEISSSDLVPDLIIQQSVVKGFIEVPLNNIRKIKFALPLSPLATTSFSSYHFPNLNTIYIKLTEDYQVLSLLEAFLSKHHKSLRKLHIIFNKLLTFPANYSIFPTKLIMNNMEHLILEDFQGGSFIWTNFPVLRHLELKHSTLEGVNLGTNSFVSESNFFESMGKIRERISQHENFISTIDKTFLQNLVELTFNKIVFEIPLTTIFQNCGHLRSLVVQKCLGVSDSALVGVREKLLKVVCPMEYKVERNEELSKREQAEKAFRNLVEKVKTSDLVSSSREFPFIGSLKELQCLSLEGSISDVTVLYGIIFCEKLRELRLNSHMCTQRSMEVIGQAQLTHLNFATINNCEIKRNDY